MNSTQLSPQQQKQQQQSSASSRVRLDGLVPRHCQRTCGTVPLCNFKQSTELLTGLRLLYHDADGVARLRTTSSAASETDQPNKSLPPQDQQQPSSVPSSDSSQQQQQPLDSFQCTTCGEQFTSCVEQREHFRSDWHLYNRRRIAKQQECVSEADFATIIQGGRAGGGPGVEGSLASSDLSSLSGEDENDETTSSSDEEEDEGTLQSPDTSSSFSSLSRHQLLSQSGRLFFLNKDREYVSLARCLFDLPAPSEEALLSRAASLPRMLKWAVLMLAGGHFAGAIFDESGRPKLHKTFHQYAVRKRQGGLQSARDSQSGGAGGPKSAGANLRRRCEAHLREKIQALLTSWTSELNACQFILVRISKPQQAIFLGAPSPIEKSDPRVRRIPISTRRPTHNELVRVYRELACLHVYDSDADAAAIGQPESRQLISRIERGLRIISESSDGSLYLKRHSKSILTGSADANNGDAAGVATNTAASSSPPPRRRQQFPMSEGHAGRAPLVGVSRTRKKKPAALSSPAADAVKEAEEELDKQDTCSDDEDTQAAADNSSPECLESSSPSNSAVQNQLFTAVACADADTLDRLLAEQLSMSDAASVTILICQPLGQRGATLLHLAASNTCGKTVISLLEAGADPCLKDAAGRTPYQLAGNKTVRDAFRTFVAAQPDRFDIKAAGIPAPLTPAQLEARRIKEADKRRTAKAAKRERDRAKKAAEAAKEAEADEKDRFQSLSDTQKMALAAERRLLAAAAASASTSGGSGGNKLILSRCFLCAADITGKVPFHYDRFEFCSTACLRQHRDKAASAAKK